MDKTRKILSILAGLMLIAVVVTGSAYYLAHKPPAQKYSEYNLAPSAMAQQSSAIKALVPVDLTGAWNTDAKSKVRMGAKIAAGTIQVDMVGDATIMSYWYGTFENVKDGGTVTSKAIDNGRIFLSTAPTKDFTYKDGKLSFQISAMGITNVVELTRG